MSNDGILTDDYVADLLSQEANDCSLKYSALGMEAFRSNKKPANMLKPNTRFLRHIIRDTDSHNKALLAREAAESRTRLENLEYAEAAKRRKTNPNSRDIRSRQMGDIHAILGGKRRQAESDGEGSGSRKLRSQESKSRSSGAKSRHSSSNKSEPDGELFKDRHDERKHRGRLSRGDGHGKSEDKSRREDRRKERSRSRNRSGDEETRHRRHRRRDSSRSPRRRHRSHSPRERRTKHRHRSPIEDREGTWKGRAREDEDSDPLDDFIGPAPPPKYRGRGTVGGSSGIDRRFSETYDPKSDVQMDQDDAPNDGSTWDDAVEAFRDGQKLRQMQDERLKAAGFGEDILQRVNAAKETKAEKDVRWSKAGDVREWDRGKEDALSADEM